MHIRPKRTDALFVSVIAAVTLLSFLQPACDKNDKPYSPNPGDSLIAMPLVPYNPQPANGAIDVGDEFALSWQCYNPDSSDTLAYKILLGIDSLYCIMEYNPTTSFTIPWRKQSRAKEMLIQIYEMQVAYHNRYGTYCLNQVVTSGYSHNLYNLLGLIIDSTDSYYYVICSTTNTFNCMAVTNLDDDATIDTWTINQSGVLEQTISDFADDCPIEFRPGTTYSWQVRVIDNHHDTTSGPIWHFTTSDSVIPVYDIGFPHFPMPENYSVGVACSTIFQWYCAMGAGDSLTYDLYLSPGDGAPQPRIMNLAINRTYPDWARQWKVQQKLWKIYEGEQFLKEYGYGGCYVLNGVSAFYGHNYFHTIGVEMEEDDIYTYTISASCDTFVCTAVANIDTDPTIDTWTVDQTGTIRHPIEDSDLPFTAGQSYSWKIIARDTHGNLYEGPVWHFTAGD